MLINFYKVDCNIYGCVGVQICLSVPAVYFSRGGFFPAGKQKRSGSWKEGNWEA